MIEKDILLLQVTDVFANSNDLSDVVHYIENGYHQSIDEEGKKGSRSTSLLIMK